MKKIKFKSAEQKHQYEELQKSWEDLKKRHATSPAPKSKSSDWSYTLKAPVGRQTPKIQSLVTPGGDTFLKKSLMYTGGNIKGIGTMHKSNSVPVFSDEQAKDLASMRR